MMWKLAALLQYVFSKYRMLHFNVNMNICAY